MARHTGGWVKLHRKVTKNWISDESASLAIFSLILMWANHRDSGDLVRGRIEKIRRGQILTSPAEIARKLKLGVRVVERRLDMLEAEHVIVQETSSRGRVITLVNYGRYQERGKNKGSKRETEGEQKGNERETGVDLGKKLQEEKNKRSNTPFIPLPGEKTRKRSLKVREKAEALVCDVMRSFHQGLHGAELERALPAEAKAVLVKRFGDWGSFCSAYEQARRSGNETPFEFKLLGTFKALLPSMLPTTVEEAH